MWRRYGRYLLILLALLLLLLLVGPLFVNVQPLAGLPPPESLATEESRFIDVPFPGIDGVTLHYHEAGAGEPTFILLHGYNFNLHTWDKVFDFFAQRGRVIAYDRTPFGLSERLTPDEWQTANPYTSEAAQAQLLALMDALAVDEAVLVGNSAGGQLALEFTLNHPQRVAGLVLVDAAIYRGGVPALVRPLLQTPQMDRLGPLYIRRFGRNDLFYRIGYVDPQSLTAESRRLSDLTFTVADWDFALWAFNQATGVAPDLGPQLATITQPALVITGDGDRIVPPAESRRAAEALPQATLAVLPQCGHFPQDECPTAFEAAVDAWLAQAFGNVEGHTPLHGLTSGREPLVAVSRTGNFAAGGLD